MLVEFKRKGVKFHADRNNVMIVEWEIGSLCKASVHGRQLEHD